MNQTVAAGAEGTIITAGVIVIVVGIIARLDPDAGEAVATQGRLTAVQTPIGILSITVIAAFDPGLHDAIATA